MTKQGKIYVELSPRDRRLLQQILAGVDTIIARWEKDVPSDVRRLVETATLFSNDYMPPGRPDPRLMEGDANDWRAYPLD